ncbi:MAG: EscU/YscU/HrcU family type III secretion system export apparatus switch protein [Kiloniellales bacterium]|nr:EscU/YscU/HrcU family type III secretion system export apparatus switch protein [Kiloniellales bacterium]
MAETSQPPSQPPRSVAVALQRDASAVQRPRVVAKGHGAVAEQILQIAFERDIKVRNDADLAEILGAVELDSEVPLEALAAVAEILSYLYRETRTPAAETKP